MASTWHIYILQIEDTLGLFVVCARFGCLFHLFRLLVEIDGKLLPKVIFFLGIFCESGVQLKGKWSFVEVMVNYWLPQPLYRQ